MHGIKGTDDLSCASTGEKKDFLTASHDTEKQHEKNAVDCGEKRFSRTTEYSMQVAPQDTRCSPAPVSVFVRNNRVGESAESEDGYQGDGEKNKPCLRIHADYDSRLFGTGYNEAMLDKKVNSLRNALAGLAIAWKEELNFRIQLACGAVAILLAWFLGVSQIEFLIIILLVGFVLSAEALNTALEEFCDMVQRNPDPHIAKIKDLAAAAVLIASFTALLIGTTIFLPYVVALS